MALRQLSLTDFRNLESTTLEFDPNFNLFIGENGSGKTSLLEAIHILCQGQSFKARTLDQCIQHGKESFLLFSRFDHYKAGISRSQQKSSIRVNNQSITKLSLLAEKTPVRIIHSNTFNLVSGNPKPKREYIDWYLFHVEHSYHELWSSYHHALKQRNALLKSKDNLEQLEYWDNYLSDFNQKIFLLRSEITKKIERFLHSQVNNLINDLEISCKYQPGWNSETPFTDLLKNYRNKDLKYGFTRYGIHRDDFKIFSNGIPVEQELSRGQLKRLSIALVLAQILLLHSKTNKKIILLIDDISSELDDQSIATILSLLREVDIQFFITNIKETNLLLDSPKESKMFHVEHGIIRTVKPS